MSTKSSGKKRGRFTADQFKRSTPEHLAELRRRADAGDVDTSDIPESSPEQIRRAADAQRQGVAAAGKERVTMFLDADIVSAFRSQGPGYQTRINHALREYLDSGCGDKSPAELLQEVRRAIDRIEPAVIRIAAGGVKVRKAYTKIGTGSVQRRSSGISRHKESGKFSVKRDSR